MKLHNIFYIELKTFKNQYQNYDDFDKKISLR